MNKRPLLLLAGVVAWSSWSNEARAQACSSPTTSCVTVTNSNATTGSTAIYAESDATGTFSVQGESDFGTGIYGYSSNTGNAIFGNAINGYGVRALSVGSDAVHAVSGSSNDSGVSGINTNGGNGVYGNSSGNAGWFTGNVTYTGSLTHYSDERLKKNIEPLAGSLDLLLRLRGVSYQWRDPSLHGSMSGIRRGFIAQEFEKVFPEWVTTNADGYKSIDETGLEALEVESIRTVKIENDALKAENSSIKKRLDVLENGHPVAAGQGLSFGGSGWGFGALALVGSLVISRRRRAEQVS